MSLKKVTLFHITCFHPAKPEIKGSWYSLIPWNDKIPFCGFDDGGKEYILPDDFQVSPEEPELDEEEEVVIISTENGPALLTEEKNTILLRA